ncbi:adenosylcobinamide-GDP ribazoletransferase [soil metagenome]
MIHELRLFFVALQFFTRVPVPRWVGFEPDWLNQSARYFPAVGLVVGGVAALVLWIGHAFFTPAVAVGLSMMASVLLTGGFHEDGWADTCDGLGGAVSRERALVIMKDSRIGAYGAIGLVLMLGTKAAALVALPLPVAVPALLLAHTASRAAATALIRMLPYAGDVEHAKAKPLAQRISGGGLAVAIGSVLLVAVVLGLFEGAWWPAIASSLLLVVAGTWALGRWLIKRLGCYTGDTLGATQQVTELLVLLAWIAAFRVGG